MKASTPAEAVRYFIVNFEKESNGFEFRERAKLDPNWKIFSSFSEFGLTLSPNSKLGERA